LFFQVTIHNKCSKYRASNRCSPMDVRSWTVAHFQKSRGVCEVVWQAQNALVNCLSFPTAVEHTSFLSVPTGTILVGWGRSNVWTVPRNLIISEHIVVWTVLLVLVGGTHYWILSQHTFCMCIYTYIYIHTYIIHTYIHAYVHTHKYIRTNTYIHTSIHTHTHAGISYTRRIKWISTVGFGEIPCVPLATAPGSSLIILTPMKILQRNLNRVTFIVWEMKGNVSVVCVCSAPNWCDTEQRSASQPGSVASGTHCIYCKSN
jgi:hypothetical protein